MKPTLKINIEKIRNDDGYGSETTVESSNYSQSDSEFSGHSSPRNNTRVANNYFYPSARSPTYRDSINRRHSKKNRKEKAASMSLIESPVLKAGQVQSKMLIDELAFLDAMSSLHINKKACEIGDNFMHQSIIFNGRTESIYVMEMGVSLDDSFPNNPPVVSHIQC